MTVTKVRRLSNPRKKRRNPKAKRRLSDKQIRHFGTKSQRAALKRRRSSARSAPKRKTAKRNPKRRSTRARRNPAMITLGILNPRKAGTMATKRKRRTAKKNPTVRRRRRTVTAARPRRRARRRNTNIVVMGKRRNPSRRRSSSRRRNPMPGGGGRSTLEMVIGGLIGAMAGKALPPMVLPASMLGSPIARAIASAATGYGLGMAAEKFLKMRSLAEGITYGGLLEGGAIVVSTYLPSVGGQLGLGAIIPGYVNPPVNPVTYRPPVQMIPAGRGVSGLRGINSAFGGAL